MISYDGQGDFDGFTIVYIKRTSGATAAVGTATAPKS